MRTFRVLRKLSRTKNSSYARDNTIGGVGICRLQEQSELPDVSDEEIDVCDKFCDFSVTNYRNVLRKRKKSDISDLNSLSLAPNTLRVHTSNGVYVILKERNKTLKDMLLFIMQANNLNMSTCVVYNMETHEKIDTLDSVQFPVKIVETTGELSHNFEKKGIIYGSCNSCKQSILLEANKCSKCNYTICSKMKCQSKSENFVCKSEASDSALGLVETTFNETEFSENLLSLDELLGTEADQKDENNTDMGTNNCEIPIIQINSLETQVGSGIFGTVYKATDMFIGKVAVKVFNVAKPSEGEVEAFKNEAEMLRSCKHRNVLSFFGYISNSSFEIFTDFRFGVVSEWCDGQNLYRKIHVEEIKMNKNQLMSIAQQIAAGMAYLHNRGVIHRDLKSKNIFLVPEIIILEDRNNRSPRPLDETEFEKWNVKIGDYGLATLKKASIKRKKITTQLEGSIHWMAPELMKQKLTDLYSPGSDVYAFGVVLFELLAGKLPYANMKIHQILYQVGNGTLKINSKDAKEDSPELLKKLIERCCEFDRYKRPTFRILDNVLRKSETYSKKPK